MSQTFPASGTINNIPWPFSVVCFGTRPNNTASADLIYKGTEFRLRDDSGDVDQEMRFTRTASGADAVARSTTLFQVADGDTHIAVTVSSAGAVKIYKDGTEVAYRSQASGSGTIVSDAAADLIFNLDATSHCAFYNIELSGANITSLYNGGAGTNCYNVQSGNILVSSDSPPSSSTVQCPLM